MGSDGRSPGGPGMPGGPDAGDIEEMLKSPSAERRMQGARLMRQASLAAREAAARPRRARPDLLHDDDGEADDPLTRALHRRPRLGKRRAARKPVLKATPKFSTTPPDAPAAHPAPPVNPAPRVDPVNTAPRVTSAPAAPPAPRRRNGLRALPELAPQTDLSARGSRSGLAVLAFLAGLTLGALGTWAVMEAGAVTGPQQAAEPVEAPVTRP